MAKLRECLVWVLVGVGVAAGQSAEPETCYSAISIVGAIVGTFLITVATVAACFLLHKMYWKSRKGKHLVLVTDAENPGDQYAFDNPCFREATPIKRSLHEETTPSKLEKNRWLEWSPLHSFGGHRPEKAKSLDDSCINEPYLKVVSLKSHDFTGLGFNICGNMRDGIFVKDVLHRGPAFESGCINSGDRIDSVRISFRNMVFEDALTILSYASPYEVQVHVENGVSSRPSTLIRSKRECNAVSSAERIQHPKYNRSQSISDLQELNRTHNKRMNQLHTAEKNRINQSLNKSHEYPVSPNDYPTLKLTSHGDAKQETQQLEKKAAPRTKPEYHEREIVATAQQPEPANKLHKFGIKVLPISMNPKMGTQVVSGNQKAKEILLKNKQDTYNRLAAQNEKNSVIEGSKAATDETDAKSNGNKKEARKDHDESDGGIDNVKAIFTKSFQNLKEKINQNSLGRKKNREAIEDEAESEQHSAEVGGKSSPNTNITVIATHKEEHPVPKVRSSVAHSADGACSEVPEEVTRAGDVARSNRKSAGDLVVAPRRSVTSLLVEDKPEAAAAVEDARGKTPERTSSESSSDADSPKAADGVTRPKRSKGKAPAPPQKAPREESHNGDTVPSRHAHTKPFTSDMNEIKKESDIDEKTNIFEPIETVRITTRPAEEKAPPMDSYDSDSDTESPQSNARREASGTKIELNATQVTIHHSPTLDNGNEEEVDTGRKAASLGDLSKLEADHTLSVVLERAVSLDLADGAGSQSAKKRKAPQPPPEDFPGVFDDAGYRKEPRLENPLGLNTFQRRLKKSSDFGTLEDALQDGGKSLEAELNGVNTSLDLLQAHNTHIQEFSSWLAECRKPKPGGEEGEVGLDNGHATSTINVNSEVGEDGEEPPPAYVPNVMFSVNGMSLTDDFDKPDMQTHNFPGIGARTVLVISQPNSLDPASISDYMTSDDRSLTKIMTDCETSSEPFVTASESQLDTTVTVTRVGEAEPEEGDDEPPQLPSTPMPVATAAFSSPLSSSLTYITEVKVTTGSKLHGSLSSLSSDSIADEPESDAALATSTPLSSKIQQLLQTNLGEVKREPKPLRAADRSMSFTDSSTLSERTMNDTNETPESQRRGSDTTYEYSKIPLRTMKSETGQKVLATIQSLAAKDPGKTTPESEYAKRVASLFTATGPRVTSSHTAGSNEGFFLQAPGKEVKKVPPVVPPRKGDTSLTTVKAEPSAETPADRSVVTLSSFMPDTRSSKVATWNDSLSNGDHVPSGVVNLPIKTSATKIVFESKDLDGEEF